MKKSALTTTLPLPQRYSLVSQTVLALREGIAAGVWQARLPGERELSAHLQVGRNTLRAALEELHRQGWLEGAPRQRRNIRASEVRQKSAIQSKLVALLAPVALRLMPPTAVLTVDALRDQLAKIGWSLELRTTPGCFSSQPDRPLEKLVRETNAAAWLLYGSTPTMQRWFLTHSVPCLVMGTSAEEAPVSSIDADHRATCRHAGALFLRKGHRRLALVLPEGGTRGDQESERGMKEAVSRHAEASLLVLRHRDRDHLCGLLEQALQSAQSPTAYLVARAMHALTVTTHLLRRKLRLPQDAAVLSRDDEAFLSHTSPVISRYSIDSAHFARKVSTAVRDLVEGGLLTPRAIRLIPRLIEGETA